MKTYIFIFALLIAGIAKAQSQEFTGSYWHTEMEFAEQVHILKPHRFSWQYVYGAVNADLRGKWTVDQDTIYLTLDALPEEKNPGELIGVLTVEGNLKLLKRFKKEDRKKTVLQRFNKTLPPEKAKEWANPIDYKKLMAEAEQRRELQASKEKTQPREGKYDGYFETSKNPKTFMLGLRGKAKQFVVKKSDPKNKGRFIYFEGTFEIKNDTAFATTNSNYDEIQVFGNHVEDHPEDEIKVYFRNLGSETIRIKTGSDFSETSFIPSRAFKRVNDSVNSFQFKKADTLWLAVGKKEANVYGFSLEDLNYNEVLVQPNYTDVETLVNHPIYVTKNDEIHSAFSKDRVLKRKLKESTPSLVGMLAPYPEFDGKRYYSITRKVIFKISKK